MNFKEPLKGDDLAKFINHHKDRYSPEDGDSLCVDSGYGYYDEKGIPVCYFKSFVNELSKSIDIKET